MDTGSVKIGALACCIQVQVSCVHKVFLGVFRRMTIICAYGRYLSVSSGYPSCTIIGNRHRTRCPSHTGDICTDFERIGRQN